jgi:hypothetical protein
MFLNALAFFVLQDPELNIDLYKYMRVYMVNNTILSLMLTFQWINACFRVISWTNSELGQKLAIYFIGNTANVYYFFGSIIDIFMLLDRIAIFKKGVKNAMKLSPYKMCIIAFVFVIAVEGPYFAGLTIDSIAFKLSPTSSFTVWYFKNSDFANSKLGTILIYIT